MSEGYVSLHGYEEILNTITPWVHRCEHRGLFLKIFTDILLGESMDYLNLYLTVEDGQGYLQDANNLYAVLDDYYNIKADVMCDMARRVGLDFDDYRVSVAVTPDPDVLRDCLQRYARLTALLCTCPK